MTSDEDDQPNFSEEQPKVVAPREMILTVSLGMRLGATTPPLLTEELLNVAKVTLDALLPAYFRTAGEARVVASTAENTHFYAEIRAVSTDDPATLGPGFPPPTDVSATFIATQVARHMS